MPFSMEKLILSGFILLTLFLLTVIAWMRFSAKYSRPRFAFFSVSCILSVIFLTISAMTAVDWGGLARDIVGIIAYGDVSAFRTAPTQLEKIGEKAVIAMFGAVAIYFIAAFCSRNLASWNGPTSLNDDELAKQSRTNDILSLFYVELIRLVKGQNDPLIDTRISTWKQTIVEAPSSIEYHELVRTAFLLHIPEADIAERAWRQRTGIWIGEIGGLEVGQSNQLILVPVSDWPTKNDIEEILSTIQPSMNSEIHLVSDGKSEHTKQTVEIASFRITCWSYRYLVRQGLQLRNYAKNLIKQFEQVTVGGTNALLSETFVPARVKSNGKTQLLSEVLDEWLPLPGRKHLAVTGEYGQGKSTAMLEHCVQWARAYLKGERAHDRIPLLIELRGKSPGENTQTEFLGQWASRYGLRPTQLLSLIQSGETLLIFEGFDELKNAGRPYDRHEHFNALWRFAYPGSKIIFTGRPNFFLDQHEKNSTLRVDSSYGAASNAFTELYEISMFSEQEVTLACRSYTPEVQRGIISSFRRHRQFREIVERPSMLPVVATIWPEVERDQKMGASITGVLLLEKYINAIYSRKEAELQNTQHGHEVPQLGSYLIVPRAVREALTLSIVWRMATADLKNTISRTEFDRVIRANFDNVLRSLQSLSVRSPTLNAARTLSERLINSNRSDFLESVCTDVAAAGLFVPDPAAGPSNLRFAHKQYFEYLIAKLTWARIAMSGEEIIEAISPFSSGFGPSTLIFTDASRHFDAILGENLTCFAKHEPLLRTNVAIINISSYVQITNTSVAQRLLPSKKEKRSESTKQEILTHGKKSKNSDGFISRFLKSNFVLYIAFTSTLITIISTLVYFATNYTSATFSIGGGAILSFGGIFFITTMKSRSMEATSFYLHICNRRARQQFPKDDLYAFLSPNSKTRVELLKAEIAMRNRNLSLINHPQSSASIKELVTDVAVIKEGC